MPRQKKSSVSYDFAWGGKAGSAGACIGGSRIRLASTSERLVGSCPDKRNQRFLMFSTGEGRLGLSVHV